VVLGLGALGLVVAQILAGPDRSTGVRTAPFMLQAADLAAAGGDPGAGYVRANPPVSLAAIESAARASLGQIPLPADRDLATWQRAGSGDQTTQVVLVYDDPAQAVRLDQLAVSALPGAFGLEPAPVDLPGAQDARLWQAEGYRAITFRQGGVAVFLGTTDTADPDLVYRLAQATLDRLSRASATP